MRKPAWRLSAPQNIEVLLTRVTLKTKHANMLSDSFCSILSSIGQYCAGDEKLFGYCGDSYDSRKCATKPDKIGLWFYELCCTVVVQGVKLPYLMHTFMHEKSTEELSTVMVVEKWRNAMWSVSPLLGGHVAPPTTNPSPLTFLCYDALYTSNAANESNRNCGQKYSASCNTQRFQVLRDAIHRDFIADEIGEHKSIYNDTFSELFTYHYDTQKGVGKKYNISWGLTRHTTPTVVAKNKNDIPGYSYYKSMFEICDHFNRALHDRTWAHKRGGRNLSGDIGTHHDFLMGCIVQNTLTAYRVINNLHPTAISFRDLVLDLACQIMVYSDEV